MEGSGKEKNRERSMTGERVLPVAGTDFYQGQGWKEEVSFQPQG